MDGRTRTDSGILSLLLFPRPIPQCPGLSYREEPGTIRTIPYFYAEIFVTIAAIQ